MSPPGRIGEVPGRARAGSADLRASAYGAEPVGFGWFVRVVRRIDGFFVTVVKPPGTGQRI